MRLLCVLCTLCVLCGASQAQRKLEWKLPPGKAAEFNILDKAGKPIPDRTLIVFGSELTAHSNRMTVDRYDDLSLPLLFQLPTETFKSTIGWEHTAFFFQDAGDAIGGLEQFIGGGGLKPLCAKGRYLVKGVQKKGDDEIATIDGAFTFFEIRRDFVNNQSRFTITKNDLGTLATSVQMSVPRGMILKAGAQLKMRGQERQGGRIVDVPLNVHQVIEFKDEMELDNARIQPALETALTRACDWIKKQQRSAGGWSPARPGPGGGDALALTGLAVRALLAAGIKPDDPALVLATRALRVPAPQETWALGQQILALSLKSPSKDEAEEARRLADELIRRRDGRSSLWSAGGRNDSPSTTITALALEALGAVPDAKIPDEIWKSAMDLFTGSWIEEDKEVDLELEFEPDAATIAADPKKVMPCGWPAQMGRANQGNPLLTPRKGSYFTLISAMKILSIAAERLKLDERQKQSIDLALRKGLGALQARWTLRTVPPVEGGWCAQRLEYLGLAGPALARLRLNRLAGSDWRLEGATLLLREQGNDGSWHAGTEQAAAKTAQAILFLSACRKP